MESSPTTPNQDQVDIEELIAELCISTDNENLKIALRKFQFGQSLKEIKSKLLNGAASTKDDLDKLLKFLNHDAVLVPLHPKATRPDTAHAIVNRLHNLLPKNCHLCKSRYKLQINETPCLPCSKCGQGSHKECIVQFLGCKTDVTNNSMDISNEDILKLLNPLNFPGWHYLCDPCEKEVVGGDQSEVHISSSQSRRTSQAVPGPVRTTTKNDSGDHTIAAADEPSAMIATPLGCSNTHNPPDEPDHISSDDSVKSDRLKKITCKFYKKAFAVWCIRQ